MNTTRILNGLALRLELGRQIIAREDFSNELNNEIMDVSHRALLNFFTEMKDEPVALQICRVSVKFKSIPEQQRLLDQFKGVQFIDHAFLLTVGQLFSQGTIDQNPEGQAVEHIVGDCDYSIVAPYIPAHNVNPSRNYPREVRSLVRRWLSSLSVAGAHNEATLARYIGRFEAREIDVHDIQHIGATFQQLKERFWPVFGPDVLSGFQALCDPLHQWSQQQLASMEYLSEVWHLRAVFLKLVLIRALGGYQAEHLFLLEDPAKFQAIPLTRSIRDSAFAVLSGGPISGYCRCSSRMDIFTHLIASFVNIGIATRNKEINVLKRQMADLYQRDSSAYLFLDWSAIHSSFELPANEADVHTIFLKILMLHNSVAKRFFTVHLARGRGHLVADLSSYISRIRLASYASGKSPVDRGNVDFMKSVRKLPSAAAARLVEEVTEKGMMERLAFAFSSSLRLSPGALPKVDNQASLLRLELAKLGMRHRVLSERSASRIIEDETHFLRMHQFHTLFRAGRVKIDWDYLEGAVEGVILENFDFLLVEGAERSIDAAVLENVIKLASDEISEMLLFNSESSLEQALNNNVRHGVLVPRFVRVFSETVVAALDHQGAPGDLSDESYARFGESAPRLLILKESVTDRISNFKDYWLTIQPNGDFQIAARAMISRVMQKIESGADSGTLAGSIIEQFRQMVEKILADALGVFIDKLRPEVFQEIERCRMDCSKEQSKNVTTFIDLLEPRMKAAFDEISGWLGLAKVTADVPDFELIDLIRFEATSLIFSDFKKLHIRHGSYVKKGGKFVQLKQAPRIKGEYFEVAQEIVHNVISNAFKYSGMGMSTEISINVYVDDVDLVFRCSNSFARKRLLAISGDVENVNRLIHESLPSQGGKDSLSGFAKIKNVCWRKLFEEAVIHVPRVSERNLQYVVEIRIPGATSVMIA